ncbi:unnamed protein product [Polarella glacialis]|uniref:Carrier domain-containing protein n=1 Tax=Polarella glacialis TaxID=89957 RepID=A0A813HHT5_POLGL|nr:unnamed protein product [Polarella glacialis]
MATIQEAFEAQVRRMPSAVAVVDGITGAATSYSELDAAANRLAARLRRSGGSSSLGLAAAAAVLTTSSPARMLAYYACLKAGLAFCPLELGWPPAACSRVLQLVQPAVFLTAHLTEEGDSGAASVIKSHCESSGIPVFFLDSLQADGESVERAPASRYPAVNSTAHIIFTSGSSGSGPKAVLCDHRGSLLSHAARVPSSGGARFGCAVFGVWDAVAAHLASCDGGHGGVAVMLPDAALRDPEHLAALIATNDINRMLLTPTLLDSLLSCAASQAALSLLDSITLCGELPSRSLVSRAKILLPESVQLINLYSSCEAHDIALGDLRKGFELRPLPHVSLHVIDETGAPTTVGSAGSLLVSGEALARGYIQDDRKSHCTGVKDSAAAQLSERFTVMSLREEESGSLTETSVVRTGDRALVVARAANSDRCSVFELEGREDVVVKIRGSTVDLEAVEQTFLRRFPGARACAAVALQDSSGQSGKMGPEEPEHSHSYEVGLACVWAPGAEEAPEVVRTVLASELSATSVPLHIRAVRSLPADRLAGKCDRRAVALLFADCVRIGTTSPEALPELVQTATTASCKQISSAGLTAARAAAAFEQVLALPLGSVAADDSFFALGGHSISAARLCEFLGIRLSELLTNPTPAMLSSTSLAAGPPVKLRAEVQDARARAAAEANAIMADLQEAKRSNHVILLTGATGGIGQHIVQELCAQLRATGKDASVGCTLLCFVRATDDVAAAERVQQLAAQSGPDTPVIALAGDVSMPLLGLRAEAWASLANNLTTIVHAAAVVDRCLPFRSLASSNVDGVARLVQLAETAGAAFRSFHLVSSSAALPPVGTPAGDRVETWPEKGGLWTAALEGSMHTAAVHGGIWEGYSQSKWCGEQLALGSHLATVVVHRFGSLEGDADLTAALAASAVVGALPVELTAVDWLAARTVGQGIAKAVREAPPGHSVRHYSCRLPAPELLQVLSQLHAAHQSAGAAITKIATTTTAITTATAATIATLRTVPTREWVRLIEESQQLQGWPAELREEVALRVARLLATTSGLQGALGLCERQLSCGSWGTASQERPSPTQLAASCAEAVNSALLPK